LEDNIEVESDEQLDPAGVRAVWCVLDLWVKRHLTPHVSSTPFMFDLITRDNLCDSWYLDSSALPSLYHTKKLTIAPLCFPDIGWWWWEELGMC